MDGTVSAGGGRLTVTLSLSLALPPAPVQVTSTLNLPALDGVYVFIPEVDGEPIDGAPLHALALVDHHLRVASSPSVMELSSNSALTVGGSGGSLTVTLSPSLALPPAPVQVTSTLNLPALDGVYVFVPEVDGEPIDGAPLHALALVDHHLRVASSPSVMELSSNSALTVGGSGGSLTVTLSPSLALPPAPVQVTSTLKLPALDGVCVFVPEVDGEPIDGAPLHALALVDDHLRLASSPSVMELSSNSAVTSGGSGALTVTLSPSLALPPAPVQVTSTLKLPALDGVYVFVPEVDGEPIDGAPLHALALVDDHLRVASSPSVMELSSNDALTVGGSGGSLTVTLSPSLALPPAPVQVTSTLKLPALDGVYVFVPEVDGEPIDGAPLHALALVDDHLRVASSPSVMELSSNDALTVGGSGGSLTVTLSPSLALPPAPVQVTSTLKLPALDGVYVFVPEVDGEPIDGAPLHALALVDDHLRVASSPSVMELSSNDALTVGGSGGSLTVTLSPSLALPPSPTSACRSPWRRR